MRRDLFWKLRFIAGTIHSCIYRIEAFLVDISKMTSCIVCTNLLETSSSNKRIAVLWSIVNLLHFLPLTRVENLYACERSQ